MTGKREIISEMEVVNQHSKFECPTLESNTNLNCTILMCCFGCTGTTQKFHFCKIYTIDAPLQQNGSRCAKSNLTLKTLHFQINLALSCAMGPK